MTAQWWLSPAMIRRAPLWMQLTGRHCSSRSFPGDAVSNEAAPPCSPRYHHSGWRGCANAVPQTHVRWRLGKTPRTGRNKSARRLAPGLSNGSQGYQNEPLGIGGAALTANEGQLHGGGEQRWLAPCEDPASGVAANCLRQPHPPFRKTCF